MNISTKVIDVEQAISEGNYMWKKCNNDCKFFGLIDGFVCGFCLEVEKDKAISYASCTFTNDYTSIMLNENSWNSLGISAECCSYNGWQPTGRIVFRGYYTSSFNNCDECFREASTIALKKVFYIIK